MKNAAFALLLLLVGCMPNKQEIIQQPPSLRFVLERSVSESYTAFVFSSEPATIRKLVVQGENLAAADDPSCAVWEPLPGSLSCAEGVKIRASPGGYRLNLTGPEVPVGTVCVTQSEVIELLQCRDLEALPDS